MKRCTACIGILSGLILLSICSLFLVRWECRRFNAATEAVLEAVEANTTAEALRRLDTLNMKWESFHNLCGLFVNGEKLDPLRDVLSELEALIRQEHPEAVSSLERLKGLIEGIYEEEFPEIWHIL